jgi:hypothetical protein
MTKNLTNRADTLTAALGYLNDALACLNRARIVDQESYRPVAYIGHAQSALLGMMADTHTTLNAPAPSANADESNPFGNADPVSAPAAHPCNVCGKDIGMPAPSGVCSEACLRKGQGFAPAVDTVKAEEPSVGSLINAYGSMGTDAGNAVAMALALAISAAPADPAHDAHVSAFNALTPGQKRSRGKSYRQTASKTRTPKSADKGPDVDTVNVDARTLANWTNTDLLAELLNRAKSMADSKESKAALSLIAKLTTAMS